MTGRTIPAGGGGPLFSRRGVIAAGLGALAAGCAAPRGRSVSLWAQSVAGENAPLLMPRFRRATGIPVAIQALPWTEAHEKLLTAYAGDALPDVAMVANDWMAELVMLGALAPVPAGLLGEQFGGVGAAVQVGGAAYAVPWMADSHVQFYRRDLVEQAGFAAPPASWAEWGRMARAIVRRTPGCYAVLMLLDWPEHLFGFAAQQPEPMLRDRMGRGNFRSAGFRAALAHYRSLFEEGLAPRVTGSEIGTMADAFGRGWFAVMPGGAELVSDLLQRTAYIPRASWAVAQMPGPVGPATGPVAGASLAVTRAARDPDAAWRLVRYLCAPDTQLRFHAITGSLPTRPSAWAAPALAGDPAAQAFRRQLEHARAWPAVPEWARIREEVQTVAEHMVRGEFGVDAAAAEMDARVDRLLAKRRWLLDRGLIA